MEAINPQARTTRYKHDSDEKTLQALAAPFLPEDIGFMPFNTGGDEDGWAIVGPYIDARVVRRRLNEVLGMGSYTIEIREVDGGMIARVTATLPSGQTVAGEDAAGSTDIESVKGGASTAVRRAASSVLGIGEYLYKVGKVNDPYFVDCDNSQGGSGIDRADALRKMPAWGLLLPTARQEKLVRHAAEQGLGEADLREVLQEADTTYNAVDEIPQSARKEVFDLINKAA